MPSCPVTRYHDVIGARLVCRTTVMFFGDQIDQRLSSNSNFDWCDLAVNVYRKLCDHRSMLWYTLYLSRSSCHQRSSINLITRQFMLGPIKKGTLPPSNKDSTWNIYDSILYEQSTPTVKVSTFQRSVDAPFYYCMCTYYFGLVFDRT